MAEPGGSGVDLIIPWVNSADPAWRAEKARYTGGPGGDDRAIRYRSWETLRYLFRGVETFLPWIDRVFFVTWGHLPAWLDPACERLVIVNHRDYIPAEYLPTFSSHPIELNFHRIEALSERFIYANDDMFFLRPLPESFFFRDGLPVDRAVQNVLQFRRRDGIDHIVANDLAALNAHFSKRNCLRRAPGLWFSPKYGAGAIKNLYLAPLANFTGFEDYHVPCAYLKSTLRAVWEAEPAALDRACRSRIRSNEDVNQWLFRYWQLASGRFVPGKTHPGRLFAIGRDDAAIEDAVAHTRLPMICLSDDDETLDAEAADRRLCALFDTLLPRRSRFEL